MNKVEQKKNLVEKAALASAEAESKLKAARERADTCEPEDAVECANAVAVATAVARKAMRAAESAQAELAKAEHEHAQAEIERCRPLASYEKFAKDLAPLVKQILAGRRQITEAVEAAKAIVDAQNVAASTCGAEAVTLGHVRAHVVAALSRANVTPLAAEWLQPVHEASTLRGLVLELCGQSRAVVPTGYSDEQIVDLALQGKNVGSIVEEEAARVRAAAEQGMAQVAQRQAAVDAENERKRNGTWWKPSTWLPTD